MAFPNLYTVILGFDAFDPNLFERLCECGTLPNLSRYVEKKGYARFTVSNPPQSEVSWTSIATGLDPGGHGIFDFVHRDPKSYTPYVSLLPTKRVLGGFQFVPPFSSRTIFEQAARRGYPATSLWWPATFPARPNSPVNTLPGLGTPDILGKLGVGTHFTSQSDFKGEGWKTSVEILNVVGKDRFKGALKGPARRKQGEVDSAFLPVEIERLDDHRARLKIGENRMEIKEGEWSPIIQLTFKIGLLVKVKAITRVILTRLQPQVNLYVLPLQIHPLHSPWQYATPPSFVKRNWNTCGPFLTIGWPQDTTGLEDGCITDDQFLALCETIFAKREEILVYHLKDFREGLLASVFDTLDRVQHMFWRDRQDIVEKWYAKLDGLVGRVEEALKWKSGNQPHIIIVSDHGFKNFEYKVHLNRWLIDQGFLASQKQEDKGTLQNIDWSRSQVYGLGLNSLYLNQAGREGQGIVQPGEGEIVLNKLTNDLLSWEGPDGRPVVKSVGTRKEAIAGPLAEYGPDLIVGYSPGYRASAQTGLGSWEKTSLETNRDHWGADHCIDVNSVQGVLFSSQDLGNFPSPSYREIPPLAIGEFLDAGGHTMPPTFNQEDQETLEERLKSLGYL